MTAPVAITLTVNGERVDALVLPRLNLADFLREQLNLTGTHVGCEHGVCGACTIRVNGDIVRSCLMLAIQAEGAVVETIEGLSDTGEIADQLASVYDYCFRRLVTANVKKDTEPAREVVRMLRDLGSAWQEIAAQQRQAQGQGRAGALGSLPVSRAI